MATGNWKSVTDQDLQALIARPLPVPGPARWARTVGDGRLLYHNARRGQSPAVAGSTRIAKAGGKRRMKKGSRCKEEEVEEKEPALLWRNFRLPVPRVQGPGNSPGTGSRPKEWTRS